MWEIFLNSYSHIRQVVSKVTFFSREVYCYHFGLSFDNEAFEFNLYDMQNVSYNIRNRAIDTKPFKTNKICTTFFILKIDIYLLFFCLTPIYFFVCQIGCFLICICGHKLCLHMRFHNFQCLFYSLTSARASYLPPFGQ